MLKMAMRNQADWVSSALPSNSAAIQINQHCLKAGQINPNSKYYSLKKNTKTCVLVILSDVRKDLISWAKKVKHHFISPHQKVNRKTSMGRGLGRGESGEIPHQPMSDVKKIVSFIIVKLTAQTMEIAAVTGDQCWDQWPERCWLERPVRLHWCYTDHIGVLDSTQ